MQALTLSLVMLSSLSQRLAIFLWQPLPSFALRYLAHYTALTSLGLFAAFVWLVQAWQMQLPERLLTLWLPLQLILGLGVNYWALTRSRVSLGLFLGVVFIALMLQSFFLHEAGGFTNPLILLLILPVALGAVVLPWQGSVFLALAALGFFASLSVHYVPLMSMSMQSLHTYLAWQVTGMSWVFAVLLLLLLFLVLPLKREVDRQRHALQEQKSLSERDARLLSVATLAAALAHQLGTPLNTLILLVRQMQQDPQAAPLHEDLQMMQGQLEVCRRSLDGLRQKANIWQEGGRIHLSWSAFFAQLQEAFALMHPTCPLEFDLPADLSGKVYVDEGLQTALMNLMDNGARISPQWLRLSMQQNDQQVCLILADKGPGLPAEVAAVLGQKPLSQRPEGTGLGLMVSVSLIERLGGRLHFSRGDNCTQAKICLPLKLLTEEGSL